MSSQAADSTGYVLWFRRSGREPWRPIATGPSEAELTAKLVQLPSGDYLTRAAGGPDPNED